MSTARKPVLLIIRDGWGRNPHPEQASFNAVALAKKPADDALQASAPVAYVSASGLDVGLPDGQMGNSEVGHENIGAGRVVDQELVRLNKLFSEKQLVNNATWLGAIARLKANPAAKLHLMGIVSDGLPTSCRRHSRRGSPAAAGPRARTSSRWWPRAGPAATPC